jgi:F-type H+-transporting ATPase subunit a
MFLKPKFIILFTSIFAIFVISVLGGALGASFGFGFLGGPMPFISIAAETVFSISSPFNYDLKNSTVMLWIAMLILIILSWIATRNIKEVPSGLQNIFELIFQFFIDTAEEAGGKSARKFLPVVITIFLGVLVFNWMGILPGVGSIGKIETVEEWVHHHSHSGHCAEVSHDNSSNKVLSELCVLEEEASHGFVVFDDAGFLSIMPLGRGETTRAPLSSIGGYLPEDIHEIKKKIETGSKPEDIPELIAIQENIHSGKVTMLYEDTSDGTISPNSYLGKTTGELIPFFRGASTDVNTTLAIAIFSMIAIQFWGFSSLGFKGYGGKFINFSHGPINAFVGILELFGEFAKTISFTFRLFGNMFAGEIVLISMGFLLPLIGMIPFMGLELFVGIIQAFIFSMLTLVFGVMAVTAHEEHEEHD